MQLFNDIKHINPNSGTEYLFARELQLLFWYAEWRNYVLVIVKQKTLAKTVISTLLNILSMSTK